MTDPKRTTQLPDVFALDDARTIRVPRLDDIDVPTTRAPARKATLTCGTRRASFEVGSLTSTGATLTGPLTFALGDRIDLTLEIAGEPVTLAGEIVRVTMADLMTDEVAVRFLEVGATTLERIARID